MGLKGNRNQKWFVTRLLIGLCVDQFILSDPHFDVPEVAFRGRVCSSSLARVFTTPCSPNQLEPNPEAKHHVVTQY